MTSIVRSIRSSEQEWSDYEILAAKEGLTTNTWIRRALNDAVELDRTIEKVAVRERGVQPAFTQRHERN